MPTHDGDMIGIDKTTGRNLGGIDHLRQSIRDILTTPIGSRVMRRDYDSRLFSLVDKPFSASTKLAIIAATAEALLIWEPQIEIDEIQLRTFEAGRVVIDLTGRYLPDGRAVSIEGIEVT